MSKAIAQNMKPTKSRMTILLSVFCLKNDFFKLIIVILLYANNFTWLSTISTDSYCILSIRYFEVEFLVISFKMQAFKFPPWNMVMSGVAAGLGP